MGVVTGLIVFLSSRRIESSHMQHDLLGSPRDLYLRSNFDLDLDLSIKSASLKKKI